MHSLLLITLLAGASVGGAVAGDHHAAHRPWSLTAAYVGELGVRPGAQVGLEYALAPLAWLSVIGRVNLGGYVHYRYATALYADLELGVRATTTGGFVIDLLGNAGYLHQFPNGVTYHVTPSGAAVEAPNAGYPGVRLGGTIGLGADLSRTSLRWPVTLMLRLGAFEEKPLAGGSQLHPEAQLGFSWTLG